MPRSRLTTSKAKMESDRNAKMETNSNAKMGVNSKVEVDLDGRYPMAEVGSNSKEILALSFPTASSCHL